MPVLKGLISVSGKPRAIKVLIDSGAAINLISRQIADELSKTGVATTREGNMKIRVANGDRASIDEVLQIPVKLGGQWTDPVKFFVLKNLPFDILIGNPGLTLWEADLS